MSDKKVRLKIQRCKKVRQKLLEQSQGLNYNIVLCNYKIRVISIAGRKMDQEQLQWRHITTNLKMEVDNPMQPIHGKQKPSTTLARLLANTILSLSKPRLLIWKLTLIFSLIKIKLVII